MAKNVSWIPNTGHGPYSFPSTAWKWNIHKYLEVPQILVSYDIETYMNNSMEYIWPVWNLWTFSSCSTYLKIFMCDQLMKMIFWPGLHLNILTAYKKKLTSCVVGTSMLFFFMDMILYLNLGFLKHLLYIMKLSWNKGQMTKCYLQCLFSAKGWF